MGENGVYGGQCWNNNYSRNTYNVPVGVWRATDWTNERYMQLVKLRLKEMYLCRLVVNLCHGHCGDSLPHEVNHRLGAFDEVCLW
jgi:hypothetical protein